MFHQNFGRAFALSICVASAFISAISDASESIYMGRLGEATASFLGEAIHMRGVIQISTATFKNADGQAIP
jgi:hypothetical protein